jgi:predicted aconitase with swiveling domain
MPRKVPFSCSGPSVISRLISGGVAFSARVNSQADFRVRVVPLMTS